MHLSVNETIKPAANISMVVTFPGELKEWTQENINRTYKTLKNAGIKISNLYYSWGEIEETKENYNWGSLDFNHHVINEHDMKVSLEIKLIDVNQIGTLHEDIAFTSFDDSFFKETCKTFILALLDRYEGKIDYLWIGNEIDDYFYNHRDQLDDYISLYNETYLAVKAKYPEVKVGTISTFHDARRNQALDIIEKIGKTGDIIGFSLYPQMIEGAEPVDTDTIFSEMLNISDRVNKKFAITETGWSSVGFNGSEIKQAQYIRELFRTYNKYKDDLEFLCLFVIYDIPENLNKEIAEPFGLGEHKEFLKMIGSLGLVHNDGRAKEAWSVFLEEMIKLEK